MAKTFKKYPTNYVKSSTEDVPGAKQLLRLGKSGANLGDDIDEWVDEMRAVDNISDYISEEELKSIEDAAQLMRDTYMSIHTDVAPEGY